MVPVIAAAIFSGSSAKAVTSAPDIDQQQINHSGGADMNTDGMSTEYSTPGSGLAAPIGLRSPAAAGTALNYRTDIRRFAMLEREQEYVLAIRWRDHGDRAAAEQLVTSHLRLAAKVAMNYRGYGLPLSEIMSEANLGLMQALDGFDPDKGFRFSTYAVWWIRAAIQDYILRSWSLVKIGTTASQKKLFFKLRSAKSRISALGGGDLRPDQVTLIASDLGVTEKDVVDMNRRLGGDASLNALVHDDEGAAEWQDYLIDQAPTPELMTVEQDEIDHRRQVLVRAIDVLNARERHIFEARHLVDEPDTLEDLAQHYGLSRERIRQIEQRAFEKVQSAARKLSHDRRHTRAPALATH
jgi:RNA polymerase sigma-32 factor